VGTGKFGRSEGEGKKLVLRGWDPWDPCRVWDPRIFWLIFVEVLWTLSEGVVQCQSYVGMVCDSVFHTLTELEQTRALPKSLINDSDPYFMYRITFHQKATLCY
jgi:hypothetical protein